jgi:hypothetical protein
VIMIFHPTSSPYDAPEVAERSRGVQNATDCPR